MFAAPGTAGQFVFTVAKLWLVGFPAVWYLAVEREPPSWSPPRRGGLLVGAAVGLAMALAIAVGYLAVLAGRIDPATVRSAATTMGLASMRSYMMAAAGWIFVNSVVEEYVYRWFVLRQLRAFMPATWAVFGSAAIFTVHHVVAMSRYLDPWTTTISSLGVFNAGAIWCWLYLRYRSIWPGWISHAVADVAVFVIGGWLLFG
jgi:membrane protease YdiL (CAAX protease family)